MKCCLTLASTVVLLAGCQHESSPAPDAPAPESTPVTFNTQGAPTVSFSVPDMMCQHACAGKVKEALAAQPGVQDVMVDFQSKLATVAVGDKFNSDAAIATLIDYQFTNSRLIAEEESTITAAATEVVGQSESAGAESAQR